jgi:hypothetical protein
MGESRFSELENLLPEDVAVFGLDEHTACLIDLGKDEAVIKGLGSVTLRSRGEELVFAKGDRFSLDVLRGRDLGKDWRPSAKEQTIESKPTPATEEDPFWGKIHALQESFRKGLEKHEPRETTNALLELDRTIWQAKQDLENEEFISQGREILRDLIVLFGMKLGSSSGDKAENLAPLVEDLIQLRERFRRNKQWHEADAVRDSLQRAGVILEDTAEGPEWRLKS